MATTATPAGGSRNGTGPEWGGFEENIQVMASRLRLPAALGTAAVRSVGGTLPGPRSLLRLQHFPSPLGLGAPDRQGHWCWPERAGRVLGPEGLGPHPPSFGTG